ncbi:MAG TPA: hypothetical protein VNL71_08930, partial [Chloroflexota bacterium]|nr:hypothetical protein [Chloroflexota bacterium]
MRDNSAASAEAWDRIALRDAIADVFRAHGSLVLPRHEAEFLVEVVIKRAPDAPHFLDDHEPLYAQLRSAGAHAEFARLALDSMTADAAIRFVVTCCRAEASAPDSLFTPRR